MLVSKTTQKTSPSACYSNNGKAQFQSLSTCPFPPDSIPYTPSLKRFRFGLNKLSDLLMWSIRLNRLPDNCPSRFLLEVLGIDGFVSEHAPFCGTHLSSLAFYICSVRVEGTCCSLVESTPNSKSSCNDTEWHWADITQLTSQNRYFV